MDTQQISSHKRRNILQSVLLLGGMTALLISIGWLIAGLIGIWFALAGVILLAGGQRISPQMVFRMYRARRLTPVEAPVLLRMVDLLRQRAELPVTPQVYYIPSAMMNAFAVGQPNHAAIGVTDGLLSFDHPHPFDARSHSGSRCPAHRKGRLRRQGFHDYDIAQLLNPQAELPRPNWWVLGGSENDLVYDLVFHLRDRMRQHLESESIIKLWRPRPSSGAQPL